MALNDIYRITLRQQWAFTAEEILNIFFYEQNLPGASEGAEPLANAFNTTLVPAIQAVQNAAIQYTQLQVENIVPSADNFTIPYTPGTDTGDRTGDALPPFVTWSFRLNRQTTASRHGQKRFAGVSEGDQNNGVASGAVVALLDNLALLLDNIIGGVPPAIATYVPRIFRAGRPSVTIPAKIKPAVLQASFPIANAQYVSVATQNSRKFGAGS